MQSWKKPLFLASGLLGLAAVVSVPVFAASAPAATPATPPAHPHPQRRFRPWFGRRLAGLITAVNGSAVTVRTPKGKTLTVTLTPQGTVAENGQKTTLAAVSAGEDALFLRVHRHKGPLVSPAVIVGSSPITMPRHPVLRRLGKVSATGSSLTFATKKGPIATFTPSGSGGSLTLSPPGKPSRTVAVFRTVVHVGKGKTALADVTTGDFAALAIRPTRLGPRDILFLTLHPRRHHLRHPKHQPAATKTQGS